MYAIGAGAGFREFVIELYPHQMLHLWSKCLLDTKRHLRLKRGAAIQLFESACRVTPSAFAACVTLRPSSASAS
jgi:hypothetical protein